MKQFSDIETLLPTITLFPISTFASIVEKLPIVKLKPLTEVSEIKELLILTNSDFFSFLTQNSLSESDEEIVIQGTLNAFAADYYLIEIIDSSIADIGIGDCCVDILLETNYQTDTNVTVANSKED